MASFSWEMVASFWVTPLGSCETVTSPLTCWARRQMLVDSGRRVPHSVSGSKSGRSCVVRRLAFLAWASWCTMNPEVDRSRACLTVTGEGT